MLKKPPGPHGSLIGGVYRQFSRSPAEFLLRTAQEYGDVCYFRVGSRHTYLLNRPDLIEEVLVTAHGNFTKSLILQRAKILLGEGLLTSEGAFHLRQRRLMQPAFYRERLVRYSRDMTSCAERAQAHWTDGQTIDLAEEMPKLTLAIVGRTLFSQDVEHEAAGIGSALSGVLGAFDTMLSPIGGVLQRLPLPSVLRSRRGRAHLDKKIYQMIAERRKSGEDTGDLLSMLLLANEAGDTGMTDKQVRDEAMTLFLAGHETTAMALIWTLYLLSQHPQVEERLRAELKNELAGRTPTIDDYSKLQYTEMVLAESMRLYPPAWAIGRRVKQQYRLFNYELKAGSICILSPYVMHRNPRFYPEPERFDPERFTAEEKQKRPKFAYFPFGGGPRMCIGERFAWLEGALVLATILPRWRFELVPGQIIEPLPQITLRTRFGVKMKLTSV